MHFHFNKKTFLGLVGLLMLVSLLAYPGGANRVVAEGGNNTYLPSVQNAPDSLVPAGSTTFYGPNAGWRYYAAGNMPATNWNQPGFADGSWVYGSAPFGFGYGTERTLVPYGSDPNNKYITTYFRRVFSFPDPASITSLSIDLLRDDGAVVYLNGKEIYRSNMPTGTIAYSTKSSSCVMEATPETIKIDPRSLVAGDNTFAVEVHQCSTTSGDLYFGTTIYGTTGTASTAPTSTPVAQPTAAPTTAPTVAPTQAPTAAPTIAPTVQATQPPTTGRSFYVTTGGSSSGDGSMSKPWSLAYAMSQPSAVQPGDTIWVRGGTYNGNFTSKLHGTSTAYVTLRGYPGERAILRDTTGGPVIDIYANAYVNYWGLEITGSYSVRDSATYPSTYGIRTNQGVSSHHVKFINMIIHDVQAQGIGWWQALTDSEIYGSIFYFNGTTKLDHGVYVHNVSGTKSLINNIIVDNASHGLHGYAETTDKGLNNIYVEGNTAFDNGSLIDYYKRNFLLGGLITTNNGVITNNYSYYPGTSGQSLNLGYSAGSNGAKVTNNYFAGGAFVIGGGYSNLSMSGNMVYAPGGFSGFTTSNFPNNTWTQTKPTGVKVFVRPNKYEANHANITIFNWNKQNTVSVSAASLNGVAIQAGKTYELHNAQNYFGDVVTGVYDGNAINIPMTNHTVGQPQGLSIKPMNAFPEFGAFILIVK